MSRKKIKSKKKKQSDVGDVIPFELPDRRVMERQLAAFGGAGDRDDTRAQAQEIIYDAWECQNARDRVNAAKAALEIHPDCVDGYNLLAENASDIEMRLAHYRKGVEAGERELGEDFFEENAGRFWGILETRPYMRAREGLAQCLVLTEKKAEAADHFLEMLRLNPNDNQGVRSELLPLLLEIDRDEDAARILDQYEDDAFASTAYARALLEFRKSGNSAEARKALDDAISANAHVPAYLTGEKKMPRRLPSYCGFGDDNEAVAVVYESASAWAKTPGAIGWLMKCRE